MRKRANIPMCAPCGQKTQVTSGLPGCSADLDASSCPASLGLPSVGRGALSEARSAIAWAELLLRLPEEGDRGGLGTSSGDGSPGHV